MAVAAVLAACTAEAATTSATGASLSAAADGTVIATNSADKAISSPICSSADIDSGAEYQVVVDGGTTTVTAGEHTGGGMGDSRGGGPGGRARELRTTPGPGDRAASSPASPSGRSGA